MFIFFVLYVDDILLAANILSIMLVTKDFLSETFVMKDMWETSCVMGIEIFCDRPKGLLGLSQKSILRKLWRNSTWISCPPRVVPIQKGDKLVICNVRRIWKVRKWLISYASFVGNLMFLQTCTRLEICFAVRMLAKYQSNLGIDLESYKKVLSYMQGTKNYMLMY